MKIKHFFALIASFFLSACSTPTPNNSSTNNENNSIENAEISANVSELKVKKAKEMLKSDYGTLSDLALSLGYSGLYAFSRDFKKHTGIPPSRY